VRSKSRPTVPEIAKAAGASPRTVDRLQRRGILPRAPGAKRGKPWTAESVIALALLAGWREAVPAPFNEAPARALYAVTLKITSGDVAGAADLCLVRERSTVSPSSLLAWGIRTRAEAAALPRHMIFPLRSVVTRAVERIALIV
jgi:hypothetical protein